MLAGVLLAGKDDGMKALFSSYELLELASVASLTAASYASTNFDNLVVLSAYCARPGYQTFHIKLTFVLASLTVLVISLALGNAADALPANKIRYLGLVPIALGCYQLGGAANDLVKAHLHGLRSHVGFLEYLRAQGFFEENLLALAVVERARDCRLKRLWHPLLSVVRPVSILNDAHQPAH